ncbi:Bgt-20705 [Blumeria graminis f. sp. tritici]|uniref:Bgt-20705 n=2 Tax=Blumeria graminis f. sp. tritici TaxID=62690 RepID=A0A9X9MMY8_BLUGR|nr:Bgt-20705 [Blumeria graminis f. sp. tritici]
MSPKEFKGCSVIGPREPSYAVCLLCLSHQYHPTESMIEVLHSFTQVEKKSSRHHP